MKKKMVLFGLIVFVVALLFTRKPVLISFAPSSSMEGKPFFCVLNPFRDKMPEQFVDGFLSKLKNGNHSLMYGDFLNEVDNDFRSYLESSLKDRPLESWHLSCVVPKKSGDIVYCYSVTRKGQTNPTDVWIAIRPNGATFKVVNFEFGIK